PLRLARLIFPPVRRYKTPSLPMHFHPQRRIRHPPLPHPPVSMRTCTLRTQMERLLGLSQVKAITPSKFLLLLLLILLLLLLILILILILILLRTRRRTS